MVKECGSCGKKFDREAKIRTHILLNHRNEIEDTEDYTSLVTEGYMDDKERYEKGESFGYR